MSDYSINNDIQRLISEKLNEPVLITGLDSKGGGSINSAALVKTNRGNFFAKWNDSSKHKGMFEAELEGLNLLKASGAIKVPTPIGAGDNGKDCYLVMELLEPGEYGFDFWEVFGAELATLHRNSNSQFGLQNNNFVGSLPQMNGFKNTWAEFFAENRLEVQLKRAVDAGKADAAIVKKFENLYKKLNEIFPEEKPALLHGDLWGGNFMCTGNSEPTIFDPAVYYGHREMDLAMSKLFGGFDYEFYESYNSAFPLEKDWEKRVEICNLYPLLVHVNLFMGSYIQSVRNIISRY